MRSEPTSGPIDVSDAAIPAPKRHVALVRVGIAVIAVVVIGIVAAVWNSSTAPFPHVGGVVPHFSLPSVEGPGVVGTPEDGGGLGRPVVILFMANWCSICQTEIPKLAASIKEFSADGTLDGLSVIGIDSADAPSTARAFILRSGVTFPVGDDGSSKVIESVFGFKGDPYAVFVRGDGTITAIHAGNLTSAQLVTFGRQLLGK